MKIATWNVNSVKARLEHVLMWLKEASPDVVLLQEIKTVTEGFPFEPIEDLGYNTAVYGQKTYNGVAILSKFPLEDVQKGLPGNEEDPQARYIEAVTNGVRVASIYVPNGREVDSEPFFYKLNFLNLLRDHTKTLLSYDEALVLGGDYNVALSDADVHNPEARRGKLLFSVPEKRALRQVINLGLMDALRTVYPEDTAEGKDLYTWWDYRAGSWEANRGYRIDHLLLSPQAADMLKGANVDKDIRAREKPSDHAPVCCVLAD